MFKDEAAHADEIENDLSKIIFDDPRQSFSTRELAALLGVSITWLEIRRTKGLPPKFCKLSHKLVRYHKCDIAEFLNSARHKSTAEYDRPRRVKPIGRRGKIDRLRQAVRQSQQPRAHQQRSSIRDGDQRAQ